MRALDGNTLITVPDLPMLAVRWPISTPPAPLGSPVRPGITQLFANASSSGFRHRGLDIGMVSGTEVVATEPNGLVEVAWPQSWSSDYGHHVVINHGPYTDAGGRVYRIKTLYGHLDSLKVQVNQLVQLGDVIGLSGNTGLSSGPHLHWEIQRWDGARVVKLDPEDYIRETDTVAILSEAEQRDLQMILPHLKALAAAAREGGLTASEDTPSPADPESRAFRRLGRLLAAAQLTEAQIRAMPAGPLRQLLLDLINAEVD